MHHKASCASVPSQSLLTQDEQLLLLTLWCIARAPLIIGARLPLDPNDSWTLSLLTNPEVLAVQNASWGNAPVSAHAIGGEAHAWAAVPDGAARGVAAYFALFNAGDSTASVAAALVDGGLAPGPRYCARDLWKRAPAPGAIAVGMINATLPPHAAALFAVSAC